MASPRAQWGSRVGFILAAAGSAVGLGNIWKFPYITGENGGGLFVIIYLVCIALVGIPIMMAEIMIGRAALGNPWVFDPQSIPATLHGRLPTVRRHLELMAEHLPTKRMLGAIKNQIGRYFKGLPHSAGLRKLVYDSPDFDTLRQEVTGLSDRLPQE